MKRMINGSRMLKQAVISLGEPVVIAQADPSVKDWGHWQFPSLSRMADGGLHLSYSIHNDSATSCGKENPHVVSYDNGATWRHVDAMPSPDGTLLPNGDRLRTTCLRPVKAEGLLLPEPATGWHCLGAAEYRYYHACDIPHKYCGYPFERLKKGAREWVIEKHYPEIPDEVHVVARDVLKNCPFQGDPTEYLVMPAFRLVKVAPDGRIWIFQHMGGLNDFPYDGNISDPWIPALCHVVFLISDDNGKTVKYHSRILYTPDPVGDPDASQHEGFTEPDIGFMPDGSVICIMRTGGPSYLARSTDGGLTWSRPRIFDDFGVAPRIVQLGNGVTLVSYGRPGCFLRATADPAGLEWGERIQILEKEHGTCANSALIAIDDNSAFYAYSDFTFPNAAGIPVKTILGRLVSVRPE